MKHQKTDCRKIQYKKVTYEHKLFVIAQITNGQISVNYAAKKYDISRSSLNYWIKKYATLAQNIKSMSKDDTIKKLKEKIEELEFIKEFQQDVIADMENLSGMNLSKKQLPRTLAKEIAKKKINRLK
ncbi:MAG TPA: DNA-binding protein [Lutibacter sp.]|nr:DNA-binding protein [Lutibacter sp.]